MKGSVNERSNSLIGQHERSWVGEMVVVVVEGGVERRVRKTGRINTTKIFRRSTNTIESLQPCC